MTYEACIKELFDIPLFGKKSALESIGKILDLMGNPHKELTFIHVAGTNGKGSVSKMLSSIYTKAGYGVGLFTSPHILRANERIQYRDEPIEDHRLVELYLEVKKVISNLEASAHPTFFEVIFLMGLLYYKEMACDLVIIETGIGGLLDCTNIIEPPILSIITQIDYDHMNLLGGTIEAIAAHKAGIIKKGSKVIYLDQNESANRIIEERCKKLSIHPVKIGNSNFVISNYNSKGIDFSYNYKYYNYIGLQLNTVAHYQAMNASIAVTGVLELNHRFPVSEKQMRQGLKAFYWPGRMEMVDRNVVIDGAHNLNGIKTFVAEIVRLYSNKKYNIILGIKSTKDYRSMIQEVIHLKGLNKVLLVPMDSFDYTNDDVINNYLDKNIQVSFRGTAKDAFNEMYPPENDVVLCCIGSLYLAAEIIQLMGGQND